MSANLYRGVAYIIIQVYLFALHKIPLINLTELYSSPVPVSLLVAQDVLTSHSSGGRLRMLYCLVNA